MLAAIDWASLLTVVWVSLLAGVGVTTLFSLVVYGGSRAAEARRAGQGAQATLFGALAVIAGVVFALGVAFGVSIMLDK